MEEAQLYLDASERKDKELYEECLRQFIKHLQDGKMECIFPWLRKQLGISESDMAQEMQRMKESYAAEEAKLSELGNERMSVEHQLFSFLIVHSYYFSSACQPPKQQMHSFPKWKSLDSKSNMMKILSPVGNKEARSPDAFQISSPTCSFQAPNEYRCSICNNVYIDPVIISSGYSFCRQCLHNWWDKSPHDPVCPITRKPLRGDMIPNIALQQVTTFLQAVLSGLYQAIKVTVDGADSPMICGSTGHLEAEEEVLPRAMRYLRSSDGNVLEMLKNGVQPLVKLGENPKWRQTIFDQGVVDSCVNLVRQNRWMPIEDVLQLLVHLTVQDFAEMATLHDRRCTIAEKAFDAVLFPVLGSGQYLMADGSSLDLAMRVIFNLLRDTKASKVILHTTGVIKQLCRLVMSQDVGSSKFVSKDNMAAHCLQLLGGLTNDSKELDPIALHTLLSALLVLAEDSGPMDYPWVLGTVEKIVTFAEKHGNDCLREVREVVTDPHNLEVVLSRVSLEEHPEVCLASLRVLWRLLSNPSCALALTDNGHLCPPASHIIPQVLDIIAKGKEGGKQDEVECAVRAVMAMVRNIGACTCKELLDPKVNAMGQFMQLLRSRIQGKCQMSIEVCLELLNGLDALLTASCDFGYKLSAGIDGTAGEILVELLNQTEESFSIAGRAAAARLLARAATLDPSCQAQLLVNGGIEALWELVKHVDEERDEREDQQMMIECCESGLVALNSMMQTLQSDSLSIRSKLANMSQAFGTAQLAAVLSSAISKQSKLVAVKLFRLARKSSSLVQTAVVADPRSRFKGIVPPLLELIRDESNQQDVLELMETLLVLLSDPHYCDQLTETDGALDLLARLAEKSELVGIKTQEVALCVLTRVLGSDHASVRQSMYGAAHSARVFLALLRGVGSRNGIRNDVRLDIAQALLVAVENDVAARRLVCSEQGISLVIDTLHGTTWGDLEVHMVGVLASLTKDAVFSVEVCRQNGAVVLLRMLDETSIRDEWKVRALDGLHSIAKASEECQQALGSMNGLVKKMLEIIDRVREVGQEATNSFQSMMMNALSVLSELTKDYDARSIQRVLDARGIESLLGVILSRNVSLDCRCHALCIVDTVVSSKEFVNSPRAQATNIQIAHGAGMLTAIDAADVELDRSSEGGSHSLSQGKGVKPDVSKLAYDESRKKYLGHCRLCAGNLLALAIQRGKKDFASLNEKAILSLAKFVQTVECGSEDRTKAAEIFRCLVQENECCVKLVEVHDALKCIVALAGETEMEACRERAFKALAPMIVKGEKLSRKAVYDAGGIDALLRVVDGSPARITSGMMDSARALLVAVEKDEAARELISTGGGLQTLARLLASLRPRSAPAHAASGALKCTASGSSIVLTGSYADSIRSEIDDTDDAREWSEFHFRLGAVLAKMAEVDPQTVCAVGGEAPLVNMLVKAFESPSLLLWRARVLAGLLSIADANSNSRRLLHKAHAVHALVDIIRLRASREVADAVAVVRELCKEPECRAEVLAAEGLTALLKLLEMEESFVCLTAAMHVVDILTSSEEFISWEKQRVTPMGFRIAHAAVMLVDGVSVECRVAAAGLLSLALMRGTTDYDKMHPSTVTTLAHLVRATCGNARSQCRVAEAFRRIVSDSTCWPKIFEAPYGVEALMTLALGSSGSTGEEGGRGSTSVGVYGEDCQKLATHAVAKLILKVAEEPQLRRRIYEAGGIHVLLRSVEAWRGSVPQGPSETRTKCAKALLACLDAEDGMSRELVKSLGGVMLLLQSLKLSVSAIAPVGWHCARLDPTARWSIFDFCIGGAIAKLAVDLDEDQCARLSEAGGVRLMVDMFLQASLLDLVASELKLRALEGLLNLARQSPLCRQQIGSPEMVRRLIEIIAQAEQLGSFSSSFSSSSQSSPLTPYGGVIPPSGRTSSPSKSPFAPFAPSSICSSPRAQAVDVVSGEAVRAFGLLREMSKDLEGGSLIIENKGLCTMLRLLDRAADDLSNTYVEQAMDVVHELSKKHNLSRVAMSMQLSIVVTKLLRFAAVNKAEREGNGRQGTGVSSMVVEKALRVVRNLQLDQRAGLIKEDIVEVIWQLLVTYNLWDEGGGMGQAVTGAIIRALEAFKDFPTEREIMRSGEGGLGLLVETLCHLPMDRDMVSAHMCGSEIILAMMMDRGGRSEGLGANVASIAGKWLTQATELSQEQHNNNTCLACAAIPILRRLGQNPSMFKRDRLSLSLAESGCFTILQALRDSQYQWHEVCRTNADSLLQEWIASRAFYRYL
ncbi:hypothetical protein CBR_g21029 [Chara braunii]|uniref:RING-type E3 ubiquitin transferase n=1 Tax=Chara braunii TaxID=69332 RepID=A0A388L0D4_CHABU|nr:hypothetical protein CBR_g21029 [Chara braunii]|eukprot:GBG75784.1 hypothetical protein CBR_g21029 [Chara braunii]